MQISTFTRKPFDVEAVQVTEENMGEVAAWCGGRVQTIRVDDKDVRYIKVRVVRPMSEKQTQAYVGEWVLEVNKGHKVYTNKAFLENFIPKTA